MKNDHLYILWTNDNPITAEHMVIMYAENAILREWWKEVTIIIWGATSKLVAENTEIQASIARAKESGVEFSGCIACARNLGTVERLEALDIELLSWGMPLTELIKEDARILTV